VRFSFRVVVLLCLYLCQCLFHVLIAADFEHYSLTMSLNNRAKRRAGNNSDVDSSKRSRSANLLSGNGGGDDDREAAEKVCCCFLFPSLSFLISLVPYEDLTEIGFVNTNQTGVEDANDSIANEDEVNTKAEINRLKAELEDAVRGVGS
jgi:hypothetical protein